jgi:hypothetical protein
MPDLRPGMLGTPGGNDSNPLPHSIVLRGWGLSTPYHVAPLTPVPDRCSLGTTSTKWYHSIMLSHDKLDTRAFSLSLAL